MREGKGRRGEGKRERAEKGGREGGSRLYRKNVDTCLILYFRRKFCIITLLLFVQS